MQTSIVLFVVGIVSITSSMKIIPQHIKTKIVDYLKEGLSCRDVAKRVPSVSHMTVSRIFNGLQRARAGRPHKLSDHAKRKVMRYIVRNN